MQHHATLALYDCLLSAGVKIFEYQPSYLHAKVAVVDDTWVTVGSSNIDPFSLLLSREANLIAQDQTFARTLAAHLQQAIQQQAQAIRSPAQHQSRLMRKINNAAYAIVRILFYVTGYGRQHDSHYADE